MKTLTFFLYVSSGPNRGHYITIVKSHGFWLLFDDDIVEVSSSRSSSSHSSSSSLFIFSYRKLMHRQSKSSMV